MVDGWAAQEDGRIDVRVALTTAGCPLRAQLLRDIRARVGAIPGVGDERVHVQFSEMSLAAKRALMDRARKQAQVRDEVTIDIPIGARVVAISSGKGGVGKSSVTANV